MKGQTMVPPDAPEYEHVRKVTDHISQVCTFLKRSLNFSNMIMLKFS